MVELQPGTRSDNMRLGMKVVCVQIQQPPWHDRWAVEMDGASLLQLSAELISLPGELTPRLAQLSYLLESVISKGLGADPGSSADWDHGFHPRSLGEMCDPYTENGNVS